jgi:hypothetical protein
MRLGGKGRGSEWGWRRGGRRLVLIVHLSAEFWRVFFVVVFGISIVPVLDFCDGLEEAGCTSIDMGSFVSL